MLKKTLLTAFGLILLIGFLGSVKFAPGFGQFSAMAAEGARAVMPPTVVTATPARPEVWETTLTATGSVVTMQGVTLGSELAGKVTRIAFESGANVKAGDVIVQLDTSSEEAQLRSAEAGVTLAKINVQRARDLRAQSTIAQSELDSAEAQIQQAAAQADNIRSVIAKKTIRAPFSGRLGIRLVNLGQILHEGDPIAALETLDPVYVNFSLPQQNLADVAPGSAVRVTTDAAPGQTFAGKVNAINPDVDFATRSLRIQAILPNPGEKLHPGMFANIEVVLPEREKVLVIPATAVLYAPYGDSVFVIDEKKDAHSGQVQKVLRQQFVRLGLTRGDLVTITSNLNPGDTVVTSGVFKLRPGLPVEVDNKLAPDAQAAPKPDNT
jgi:membrane fusion protein (multidrug efflux system)